MTEHHIDIYPTLSGALMTVADGQHRVLSLPPIYPDLPEALARHFDREGFTVTIHHEPEPEPAETIQ